MNEFIIFLNDNYDKAIALKKKFRTLENKEWDSLTIVNEITVQIGHVYNVLNHNEYIDEINRTWITNMGDELSDVLLQLSELSKKENVRFFLQNYTDYKYDNLDGIIVLLGQLSESLLEKYEYRFSKPRTGFKSIDDFIKDRIIKIMLIIFNYCETNKIDINNEFNLMIEDAESFIDRKTNGNN